MNQAANVIGKLQIAALIVLTAGWGWSGGNFTPGDAPFWNPLVHCTPIVVLLILGLPLLTMNGTNTVAPSRPNWAYIGMHLFTIVTIIGVGVLIVMGATNPNPSSTGVHSLEDWFPVVMMLVGSLLWLATFLFAHRGQTEVMALKSTNA